MNTPYEFLGVLPDASDEEIKTAHDAIIQRYSSLAESDAEGSELAREKIRAAKQAYEQIIKERLQSQAGPSQFIDIRRLINSNRITEAEELLDGVPYSRRDAEWYFLKGSVQHSRGWLEDAYDNFTRAAQLNPSNSEYRAALNQMQYQRQTGKTYSNPKSRMGNDGTNPTPVMRCGVCDMCSAVCCTQICCNCLCR